MLLFFLSAVQSAYSQISLSGPPHSGPSPVVPPHDPTRIILPVMDYRPVIPPYDPTRIILPVKHPQFAQEWPSDRNCHITEYYHRTECVVEPLQRRLAPQ